MKKNNKKFFIEALEQRIMLDGAGASTFIDTLEDTAHDKFSLNNEIKVNKFVESANKDSDVKLPFINQTRDQKRNELRQIVFIDTQVEDYQQLIRAFDKNTEIHLIQSNENGFDKINQTLKGYKNIDSLHIIGHGSAGQILFGDALLSNDTFNQYSKTLKSIGNNLSPSGDILFYGCNIASNERGLSLISKISEITKADIAASDDVTGKGGDWHLEKNIGIIETKNIQVADYEHSLLQNGITSINEFVEEKPNATNFKSENNTTEGQQSDSGFDFVLSLERENVSNAGTLVLDKDDDGNNNTTLNTQTDPVNSYLLFMNDPHSEDDREDKIGQVVFEYEIYGIWWSKYGTNNDRFNNNIPNSSQYFAKEGATYPTRLNQIAYRGLEGSGTSENPQFYANNHTSSTKSKDWVSIGADNRTLRIGVKNDGAGDYIRIFTAANAAPVARNDEGVIVEDGTLIVENSANANLSGTYDATGEHSGDVINTSSSLHSDSDLDDSASLNITLIKKNGGSDSAVSSGSSYNSGTSVTGTYGTLTIGADGSYTYIANTAAAEALDAGDTANDVFHYTLSDGTATDTATITIKVLGATDEPTSTNTNVYKEEKEEGKKKSKKDIRRERREKRQERRAERIEAKKFELPESSDKKFNQGLKLVDLVAESNSEDELSLKFKVFNDEGKEVQKYYGIMKDGSELPAWITVDSKTGKASTDIPKDIDLLEFKIIAVDTDNNKKQVTVIIDPEKISQDKDIMKQVNKKNSSNITVNNNGLVELNTTNEDGLTIKTATDAVNQNKSFKDIVSSIEANEEFKIQSESRDFNSDFIFKLENILEPNFDKIKLVLKNGSEIPSWISFNEATGKITANPPAGIEAMDFKIIIEDTDGVVTVKDLEIDFIKNDNNTLLDIEDTEINFVSFNQQLIIESDNLDNYGEKLINNL